MTYRFYLTIISSRVEVFPLNFLKTSLVDQKDRDQIYYRRKFNGSLRFYCNKKSGTTDFDLLYMIEQVDNCTDLILEIEQKDSGVNTYHPYWTGHFATVDGQWDIDNSTFDVTPRPYDVYTPFDSFGDTEYNIYLSAHDIATQTIDPAETYDRNFWLVDVIEYLTDKVSPGATVVSTFLNNATNPVTLDINKYQHLTIAQKSDIKRPASSNPVTCGMMSFNGLMSMLRIFNLFWSFDGTVVRIEHYDYWQGLEGLDLRTQLLSKRANRYEYVSDLPMYERFRFMEAEDINFTEHIISYNPSCVNPKSSIENTFIVTTDLDFIYNSVHSIDGRESTLIDDNGWVILANQKQGVNYVIYWGVGFASSVGANNYPMSWSYLLRTLFMHGRSNLNGFINGSPIAFISTVKTKKQDIKAIICYEDSYDPEDNITTELGEVFFGGQKASVATATLHPDGHTEFNLLYGEDKNITPTPVPKYKTLHCTIDLPRHIYSHLTEANLVDTYYTVLLDDGLGSEECYEVIIPAGVVFQDDITDIEHTVVSGIYTGHSSLTGWQFIYNTNETWTEVADCSSPPAPPGLPPTAPALYGATQADQWDCVNIGWSNPATTTYYEIYRSIDGAAYELIDTVPSTWSDYDDCESQNHAYRPAMFCYKIKACNVAGCSADSNEKCVDVNDG